VSAVDIDSHKAFYSNFGIMVDVAAPGGDTSQDKNGDGAKDGVISTLADDSTLPLQFLYAGYQGTSMATPHVAGVVALMRSVNPALMPLDINQLLSGTHPDPNAGPITTDLGAPGRDDVFGYGLIEAFQAVNVARNIAGGGGGTPPPADTPVLAVTPGQLNFSVTTTLLQLAASNPGTARLEITAVTDDASWLAVETPALPFGIDAGSAAPFLLTTTVNRSGLNNGSYLGNIHIKSNGGDRTVTVAMQVRPEAGGDLGTVYVLVLDPETLDPIGQTQTSITDGYGYEMPVVSPGRYIVAAGTDRDNDGLICESGEACGIFPLVDSPTELDVDGDLWSVDFPVAYDFFASNATAKMIGLRFQGVAGFRRLDP
jgi:serine protease